MATSLESPKSGSRELVLSETTRNVENTKNRGWFDVSAGNRPRHGAVIPVTAMIDVPKAVFTDRNPQTDKTLFVEALINGHDAPARKVFANSKDLEVITEGLLVREVYETSIVVGPNVTALRLGYLDQDGTTMQPLPKDTVKVKGWFFEDAVELKLKPAELLESPEQLDALEQRQPLMMNVIALTDPTIPARIVNGI